MRVRWPVHGGAPPLWLLRLPELASFNKRIEELEKKHPDASKIEALRASALVLARQIDEIRCSSANDLTGLLAN